MALYEITPQRLKEIIRSELVCVEKRLEGVLAYLKNNAQYWDDKQGEVEFLRQQIERLKSIIGDAEV